jgi:hypothetical protein
MILMKKLIILSYCILLASFVATAQEAAKDSVLRSKKGIPILPQKGDWGIGFDAIPYLNYAGNMFNNKSNNTLNLGTQTIFGRYFISDNAAIRGIVSVNQYSNLSERYVRDDAAYTADPLANINTKTTDTYKSNHTEYVIGLGYQKFRGYGRLKGFYGFQAGFGVSRDHYFFTYGNPMTTVNSEPTSISWGSNQTGSIRTLEIDNGITKTVNVGLIAGVECYIFPKICIGGEINLSLSNSWKSQGNSKYEHLNNTVVEEYDVADSPKGRTSTSFTSKSYSQQAGTLYLMFHF